MADNQLDILIRILTQEVGAQKAEEVLKKVKTETKAVTEETKKATKETEENTKATDKTVSSKKQLHGLLRGLATEFPVLGRVASLVMNPISLSVATIAAAFGLWKRRVDEVSNSLSGFQMPDVSADQLARIEAGTTALGKFAVEMAKLQGASKLVKDDLANVVRTIKIIDELRKAAGLDTGTKAKESEAAAKDAAATRLEMEARSKIAAGGTPGSPEAEAALAAQYKAAAEAAVKAQATARGRLGDIGEMQNAPWWQQPYQANKFRLRYGSGTTYDEARAMEQGNISSAQVSIDQYESFRQGSAARGGRRAMIEGGNADLGEVARLRQEVADLRSQIGVSRTGAASAGIGAFAGQAAAAAQSGDVGGLAVSVIRLSSNIVLVADALRAAKMAEAQIRQALGDQRRN